MGFVDIIAIVIIALLFFGIFFIMIRNKKKGKTCCGCSSKPGEAGCHCNKSE